MSKDNYTLLKERLFEAEIPFEDCTERIFYPDCEKPVYYVQFNSNVFGYQQNLMRLTTMADGFAELLSVDEVFDRLKIDWRKKNG